jgi:very-short-patch-repair endonuclease
MINNNSIKFKKDQQLSLYRSNQGFTVIRFKNKLVFEDPEYVIETIKKHFKDHSD